MASNLLIFSGNQLTTVCQNGTAKFGGLATIWGQRENATGLSVCQSVSLSVRVTFLPRDAMLARVIVSVSVRLSQVGVLSKQNNFVNNTVDQKSETPPARNASWDIE